MTTDLARLRVTQTDAMLAQFSKVQGVSAPPGGWLRAVREALGRPLRAQATRLGIAATTLYKSEVAEADERISLAQLRKLAAALDCELIYGLVPRQPLTEVVQARADTLARAEVMGVAHSMALEDQRPSEGYIEHQVAERRNALLSGSWSKLWK